MRSKAYSIYSERRIGSNSILFCIDVYHVLIAWHGKEMKTAFQSSLPSKSLSITFTNTMYSDLTSPIT